MEPLGRGGNATVYLVISNTSLDKGIPFAAKFFLHDDPERRKAFLREIDYLEQHPHKAILTIYDSDESSEKIPFYISRYMATTLDRVLLTESAPLLDKLLYASQLSSALSYLASAHPSILHRDIKAQNILVSGRACVLREDWRFTSDVNAVEFLTYQITSSGQMVRRALSGLEGSSPDVQPIPSAMNLGDQITHLAEAYQAVITGADGGKYEWGSFKFKGSTTHEMIDEMSELRGSALEKVLVDDEERLKMGADYIVGHDNYHLGQLVSLHLAVDPSWDSYQIYG